MSPDWSEMRWLSGGKFLADTEAPGRAWLQRYIHPDDQPRVIAAINQAIRNKSIFELEHPVRRSDGSMGWTSSRAIPVLDSNNQIVEWFGSARDITQRKQAEERLRESEARFRNLFDSMDEGFASCEMIYDASDQPVDFRFTAVNPAFGKLTGMPAEQVLGRTVKEVIPGIERFWIETYDRIVRTGKSERIANPVAALGRQMEAFAWCTAPGRFAVVFNDVTERNQAEERLRQRQKLESIGLLAAGVAHDFNNLLTVIMGNASAGLGCPRREQYENIINASEQAAHLTRQLLAYAGKGQFVIETLDLNRVVSRMRDLLVASVPKKVALSFVPSEQEMLIDTDPSQIEQILMNLVINASEAIPPQSDGRIEIATSSLEVTPEMARQQPQGFDVRPGRFVGLEVTDDGIGMDQATLARIFDPFFSTKFAGRGLGLAALQGAVRSRKGFIDVQSFPGAGSKFRVFLPAAKGERAAEPAVSQPGRARPEARESAAILVVDDEEMVRKLASTALRDRGYEVLEAQDGRKALEVLAGGSAPPSLALIDLAMPVMGGDELVPILHRNYPGLKIVLTSGYPEEEARKNFPPGAVAGFLQKPYTVFGLAEKVEGILRTEAGRSGHIIEFPRTG